MQQYEGMAAAAGGGGGGGQFHPETVQARLAAKLVLETDALLYGEGDSGVGGGGGVGEDGENGDGNGAVVGSGGGDRVGKELARILGEGEKDDPDLYRVLGLSRWASAPQVKDAFRRLVLLVHPDKLPGSAPPPLRAAAAEAFQLVQEAYEALASPGERRKYDAYRVKLRRKRWRQRVRPIIDKLDEWGDYAEPFWRRRRRIALGLFLFWALVL